MKNAGKTLIYAVLCVALAMAARAASVKSSGKSPAIVSTEHDAGEALSSDNPYGAIVERNVFDLHDAPPPPADKPDKGPPPNVKLTGITTIFGNKQALFIVTEPGAAGKAPGNHSIILSEGQRNNDLEVLEINTKARTARVKIDEVESLLNIETNKTPSFQAGGPGAHAPAYAPPGGTPPGFPHNPYGSPQEKLPSRPTRTEVQPGQTPQPNYGAQPNATPQNYGAPSYAGGGAVQAQSPVQQQPQLTPEQQYTLVEAQRAQAQAAGDPVLPIILPPTPYTQALNPTSEGGNGGPTAPTAPTAPSVPGARGSGSLGGGILAPH